MATEQPNSNIQVVEVRPETARFDDVLELASRVLAQHRDLTSVFPAAQESHVLAAFQGARCAGFLPTTSSFACNRHHYRRPVTAANGAQLVA